MAENNVPFWRRLADAAGLQAAPAAPSIPMAPAPAPMAPAPAPSAPSPPLPAPDAVAAAENPDPAAVAGEPGGEALLELWFARADDAVLAWSECVPGPSAAEIGTRLSLVPATFLHDNVAILQLTEHILQPEYGSVAVPGAETQATEVLDVVTEVRASGSAAARRGAALALWLWASDDLHGPLSVPLRPELRARALAAFAFRLAAVVDPAQWVSDAEHRDEAARTFLFWSGHLPAGDDEAAARSLLDMRDSLAHNAALAQTLAEHEHRLAVTRRLQAARSREAAARYSHE